MTVYFIGGGPGDPELLTIKARKAIEKADIVVYAGSLVSPRLLEFSKPGAELIDSSPLDLEGLQAVFLRAEREGKDVARIHSGDLSLYSAAQEQMDWCQGNGVDFVAIPGVSSFSAACASLHQELTLPGVSQTVILTRLAGRTPVPSREDLAKLAGIGASMVIFLSVQRIEEVVGKLKEAYPLTTPVAVVERASWPEETIIRGNLEDIAGKVKRAKIRRTALIIVGEVLNKKYRKSRLYAAEFEHAFRTRK
ncbi:MAG: precorrin-4 C(11)-methyltransferase [Dehalococcoidia bacterium]|nr:precorrin-4 C(11)-methyltransferase [Dehalococcoidia bacterium]